MTRATYGMADAGELHVDQHFIVAHFVEDDIFKYEGFLRVMYNVCNGLDIFSLDLRHYVL